MEGDGQDVDNGCVIVYILITRFLFFLKLCSGFLMDYYIYECVLCVFGASDAAGTRVEKGDKSMPKRPKMVHYRDKGGAKSSFFKIIKSTW